MSGSIIWLIFVLMWFWPGSVGRWLSEVRKAYDAAMRVEDNNNG